MVVFAPSPELPPPGIPDRSRTALARGWTIAGVVCCITFLVSIPLGVSYTAELAIWFATCLCGFHAYFAQRRNLRATTIKALDYWYLGIAAIGIIFLASAYAESRGAFINQLHMDQMKSDSQRFGSRWPMFLSNYASSTCLPAIDLQRALVHCKIAQELEQWAQNNHTLSSLQEKAEALRQFALEDDRKYPRKLRTREGERTDTPFSGGEYQTLSWMEDGPERIARLIDARIALIRNVDEIEKLPKWKVSEPLNVYFGLVQTALWPFILAIAFALRLTKVTMEVFGWANEVPSKESSALSKNSP